eukprot:10660831-Alexandrium_andersonii.AAC.1
MDARCVHRTHRRRALRRLNCYREPVAARRFGLTLRLHMSVRRAGYRRRIAAPPVHWCDVK